MTDPTDFVSRAGHKLEHALAQFALAPFHLHVPGKICADLGCKDPRVVVMERTNAMHATLPEKVALITIDVAWTRQRKILPAALSLLGLGGRVVTLIKPHYEAPASRLRKGILPEQDVPEIVQAVTADAIAAGFDVLAITPSPIHGAGGNAEALALLKRTGDV
jgi:23S rRNA (cytidine1920-2'-O)/16S rRNA (cytidine1409-2'-O)-methyltransferase